MTNVAAVLLALVGLACFAGLGIVRYRHRNGDYNSRLLFVDIVLVAAALEIVADRLSHIEPAGSTLSVVAQATSALLQGAIMAGGMALVLSYRR